MIHLPRLLAVSAAGLGAVVLAFASRAESPVDSPGAVRMAGENLAVIRTGAIYPEGIEYNPVTGKFLLGAFREGGVYEIDQDGGYRPLVTDERLVTVLGIRVDVRRNRLLVATSDLGVSKHRSIEGPTKFAALGIYNLATGAPLKFVNLGSLRPASESHLANDLAIDNDGNAYITDSLAPVIYRVDVDGNASVLVENKAMFSGDGVNLNGIVFHPGGYLIVVKKSDGSLFKVPLQNPAQLSIIQAPQKFVAGDGLVLVDPNKLIVIANRVGASVTNTAFALSSADDWTLARIVGEFRFPSDDYPTTGAVKDSKIFVSAGGVNRLLADFAAEKATGFSRKAVLQQVGVVGR